MRSRDSSRRPMRRRGHLPIVGLVGFVCASLAALPTRAADCTPETGVSSCLDANALWLTSGDARFFSIPRARALAAGSVGLSFAAQALWRPLRLTVPSPSDSGRDVELVKRAVEQDTLLAVGLGRQLELGIAFPVVLHQSGSGSQGITSQAGPPLESSVMRDPRISLSGAFHVGPIGAKPGVTLTIPAGSEDAYASAGGFTIAPTFPISVRHGRFEHALELGARFRRSVEIGSERIGSEARLAIGTSFDIVSEELLALCVEGFIAPSLIDNQSVRARPFGVTTRLLSAEYLVSLRSRPSRKEPWTVALGAGSALALSRESTVLGDESFIAPPGPALRLVAEVRYAPSGD